MSRPRTLQKIAAFLGIDHDQVVDAQWSAPTPTHAQPAGQPFTAAQRRLTKSSCGPRAISGPPLSRMIYRAR